MANAMLIIQAILEIQPPAATSVPSIVKINQAPFISRCNPAGIHMLKFHSTYIQLK